MTDIERFDAIAAVTRPAFCPACLRCFSSNHAVKVHFGRTHSHLAYPWPIAKQDVNSPRTLKVRPAKKVTYPRWPK